MTIAAGLLCPDGIVLAADTEYSTGYAAKVPGKKVFEVAQGPDLSVVIACAGDVTFMRMAVEMAARKLAASRPTTIDRVKADIESVLRYVFREHVYKVPGTLNEKPTFQLLIGCRTAADGLSLLSTSLTGIYDVEKHMCIGAGADVASCIVEMVESLGMAISEAELLAIYAVKMAKQYAQFCGKRTDVALMDSRGSIRFLQEDEIEISERYVDELLGHLSSFFMCLGPEVPKEMIHDVVARLEAGLIKYREGQRAYDPMPRDEPLA